MKNDEEKTERALIIRIKTGDASAFKELLQRYNGRVYGYFLRTFGQREIAQDLFQETFLRVWRSLDKYDQEKKFSTWVFTIAERVSIDAIRARSTHQKVIINGLPVDRAGEGNPESDYQRQEMHREIERFVSTLPPKQRKVFLLRQQGDLPFKEIAEVMNEPLNSVLSHMHYAIKKLQKHLRAYNET